MAERIARHRAERPAGWTTVEEPVELARRVAAAGGACVVVDCLSLWVANLLERGPRRCEREARGGRGAPRGAADDRRDATRSGSGVVPATPARRARYRDVLGRVNAIWARAADEAYFVVAGRVLAIAG